MFFWHPHPTFDFWHHHAKHKHHDRPTPPLGADSDGSPSYEVFLEPVENPQELTLVRRWLTVICISTASICVTCASSMVRVFCFVTFHSSKVPYCRVRQAAFAEMPVAKQFHVSKEVAILGVSLFVLGLGLGPLVAGPTSEIYGRNIIYRVSFALFFLCTFPVAFAPDICMCFCCALSLCPGPVSCILQFCCDNRDVPWQLCIWPFGLSAGTAGRRFSAWLGEVSVICSLTRKLLRRS